MHRSRPWCSSSSASTASPCDGIAGQQTQALLDAVLPDADTPLLAAQTAGG